MEQNKTLAEYYSKFNELPPNIMMVSYDDEKYLVAMEYAIYKNEKITDENIGKFFKNNYDLVSEDNKQFKTFKKGSK